MTITWYTVVWEDDSYCPQVESKKTRTEVVGNMVQPLWG
jgi:hypothetical protein